MPKLINSEKQKINAQEPKNCLAEDQTRFQELNIDFKRPKTDFQWKNYWDPLICSQLNAVGVKNQGRSKDFRGTFFIFFGAKN